MTFVRNGDFTNLTFNPGLYNNIGAVAGYPGPSSNVAAAMSDPGPYLGQGGGRRRKNSSRKRQRSNKRGSRKMKGGTVFGTGMGNIMPSTVASEADFLDASQGSEFPQIYSGGKRKSRRRRGGKRKTRKMKGGYMTPNQGYGYAGTLGESTFLFAGSGYPPMSRYNPTDCVVNPTTESGGAPITETVRGQIGGKRRKSKRNKRSKKNKKSRRNKKR